MGVFKGCKLDIILYYQYISVSMKMKMSCILYYIKYKNVQRPLKALGCCILHSPIRRRSTIVMLLCCRSLAECLFPMDIRTTT